MKRNEIYKTLGSALVTVADAYTSTTVPLTFDAYVDVHSIDRDATGKVISANTLFTARWDLKHMRDINWETLIGDVEVLDAVNRFISNLGISGRIGWAPMSAQEPEQFQFRMKPFMVDEFFPELGMRHDVERSERRQAPRPSVVGRPTLSIVGRASA
ncbi:hypothetical protein G6L37_01395 [Agrobacterium rubi]|nr:hypothetical protein [Agrobacterium rubi]NTF24047.1 hypothetical protein [Agrobacterium rubi]